MPEQIQIKYYGDRTVVLQGGTALMFGGNDKETPLDAALAALRLLLKNTRNVVFENCSGEDVSDLINAVYQEFSKEI